MTVASLLPFYAASLALSVAGLSPLNAMILAVPVAFAEARGRHGQAITYAGAGLLTLAVGRGSLAAGVVGSLIVLSGVAAGYRARRNGWFGQVAATFALVQFTVIGMQMASLWPEHLAAWQAFLDSQARQMAGTPGADAVLMWRDYLPYLVPGAMFAGCYTVALLQTQALYGLLRRAEPAESLPPPQGRFALTRPADWLVWLAIVALAGLALDYFRPHEAVRFVAWNLAVALSAVYWFNGLGIVLFGFEAFRVSPLVAVALLAALILTSMHSMLLVFGFFDTWFDHRLMLARVAAARRTAGRDGPDGDPPGET